MSLSEDQMQQVLNSAYAQYLIFGQRHGKSRLAKLLTNAASQGGMGVVSVTAGGVVRKIETVDTKGRL